MNKVYVGGALVVGSLVCGFYSVRAGYWGNTKLTVQDTERYCHHVFPRRGLFTDSVHVLECNRAEKDVRCYFDLEGPSSFRGTTHWSFKPIAWDLIGYDRAPELESKLWAAIEGAIDKQESKNVQLARAEEAAARALREWK